MLLLPTVISNSSIWAQCDSIYTSILLCGVYLLIRERPWWGCAMFGLSYSLKQQAIILFPVLMLLLLARKVPWRALLAIPAVYLATAVPAMLLGRDPIALLLTYPRQAAINPALTLHAPNVYQFFDAGRAVDLIRNLGVLATAAAVLAVIYSLLATRLELTAERIVLITAGFALLVPFLLPSMHERYFYLADVLTVVIACYRPRRLWYVPILLQSASFLSYTPFLLHATPESSDGGRTLVDQRILAVFIMVALAAVGAELIRDKAADRPKQTDTPEPTDISELAVLVPAFGIGGDPAWPAGPATGPAE